MYPIDSLYDTIMHIFNKICALWNIVINSHRDDRNRNATSETVRNRVNLNVTATATVTVF
jgi:hypothetical protein